MKMFDGSDACVAPVVAMREAAGHPHNVARATFVEHARVLQPVPAPRFWLTPAKLNIPPCKPGAHTDEILKEWIQ